MNRQEQMIMVISGIKALKNITEMTDVTEATLLKDDLGMDSLDIVELQMWVEENSKIIVGDPTGPVITIKDILDLF
jgi:acyl carrier protein